MKSGTTRRVAVSGTERSTSCVTFPRQMGRPVQTDRPELRSSRRRSSFGDWSGELASEASPGGSASESATLPALLGLSPQRHSLPNAQGAVCEAIGCAVPLADSRWEAHRASTAIQDYRQYRQRCIRTNDRRQRGISSSARKFAGRTGRCSGHRERCPRRAGSPGRNRHDAGG